MQAKSFGAATLQKSQTKNSQLPCINRKPKFSTVSIHKDIASKNLPIQVSNKLFFHYHHICAVMGCPYAPLDEIKAGVLNYKKLISVFPKLAKGTRLELAGKYNEISNAYFNNSSLTTKIYSVSQIIESELHKNYPDLESGLAYLFSPELNGKRHKGNKTDIIKQAENEQITVLFPENLNGTPIMLFNDLNDRAIIISNVDGEFNQQIIEQIIKIDGINIKIK